MLAKSQSNVESMYENKEFASLSSSVSKILISVNDPESSAN